MWYCTSLGEGTAQPHPHVLEFPQSCFVHEYFLVVLLVRGSEVRSDLCCHHGDQKSDYMIFIILAMWCFTFIDLYMLNHPCIPRINPTWLLCIILLVFC